MHLITNCNDPITVIMSQQVTDDNEPPTYQEATAGKNSSLCICICLFESK